jgi:threonine dehydrogenase-like Zn-dependent dehydrogenase
MKAAVMDARETLRVADVPDPEINEKEVLVKVDSCGICGSDVKIYQGHWTIPFPRVLGHEFSGVVVDVGSGVSGFKEGDRVAVDPNEACGECEYCRTDRPHFCPNMIDHGIFVDGGLAEYAKAGEKVVYKLPDAVSLLEGSFTELLSCCVQGINRAQIRVGDSVAVFGGGPAGQILHQLASVAGAGKVTLFTHSKEKLDLARKLGASEALNPDDVSIEDFEFDVAIDAVGAAKVIEDSLKCLTKRGRLLIFGQAAEGEHASVDLFNLLWQEVTIIPSFLNPFTASQAIRLLEEKKIDVESLVSHTVSLDDAQRAFDLHTQKVPGTMKVVISP